MTFARWKPIPVLVSLLDCETVCVCENDTSALGACMLAMTGCGLYRDLREAIAGCVSYLPPVRPMPQYRETLLRRFEIYKKVYRDLRMTFRDFHNI